MPLEYGAVLCWCLLMGSVARPQILHEETVAMSETTAVLTGVARLPCDLDPASPDDKVLLVIWYKDGAKSPIYSLDVRGRSLDQPTHWADERMLGGRSFFRVSSGTSSSSDESEDGLGTHLAVENVREADAGSYRCRVDFKHSPTRNSVVNLTVIVPPRNVTILDEQGTSVEGPFIGPYTEGSTSVISCIASGGRPPPRVTWWHAGNMVDDSDETLPDHRVKNTLLLGRLQRSHLHEVYTCQAINNNVLSPVSSNVSIDMHLQPLDVRLLGDNKPLSAGNKYEIVCLTIGSRPPAHISWWKGGAPLDTSIETISSDGNVSTSTLTLTPTVDDLGKYISCRANNSYTLDSVQQDGWTLNILYSPIVTLELGSNLNGSSIREGVDVYFECNIRANPWIYKIIWRHNGKALHNNASAGTILSNQTLVLQSVGRATSGLYTCVAGNSEGDSESNPFNLDVKYEPVCASGQQRVYGAARLEEVEVVCDVDANPPAMLFRWTFNNSAVQSTDVGTVVSAPEGGRSIAVYSPQAERDYGTLLCWGRNDLGSQDSPCVFHIVPGGKPDPPKNCSVTKRTATSLQVTCVRGFDGGLPQVFTLELYTGDAQRRLMTNTTNKTKPQFTLSGLEPGTSYRMTLYASNGKGRSRQVVSLRGTTLKVSQLEHQRNPSGTTDSSDFPQVTPLLWLLAGIVGTLGLLGLTLVVILRLRGMVCYWCDSEDDDTRSSEGSSQTDPGKMLTVSLTALKELITVATEDTTENPDIIPQTNDTDFPKQESDIPEMRSLGLSTQSFSVESPVQTISCDSYPRSSTSESLAHEIPAVRWQQVAWRDMGTQSQEHLPVATTILTLVPTSVQRQHAQTQTPLPVRHKESALLLSTRSMEPPGMRYKANTKSE